jgi:hypothetical protein
MYSVGGTTNFTVRGGNGGGGGGRHGGSGGGTGGSSSSSSGSSGGGSGSSSSGSSSSSNGSGGSANSHFTSSGYTTSDSGSYASDSSGLFTTTSDTTTVGGANGNLSFDSSSASVDSGDAAALLGVGGMAGLYGATGSNIVLNQSGWAGADNAGLIGIFGPRGPGAFGPGGGPGGFHGGGFGGPGGPGGEGQNAGPIGSTEAFIPPPAPAGTANIAGAGASGTPPKPGGAPTTPEGRSFGGGHGDYSGHGYGHGLDTHSYSAVVRFNQVEKDLRAKPVIHAIAADPASNEVWVTIGDVLLHFDSSGNREDSYLVTTNTGAPLSPVGILVEPNRLLLVGDPTGIYDFARPDKAERTAGKTAIASQSKSPATGSSAALTPAPPNAPGTKNNVAPGTAAKNNSTPQ